MALLDLANERRHRKQVDRSVRRGAIDSGRIQPLSRGTPDALRLNRQGALLGSLQLANILNQLVGFIVRNLAFECRHLASAVFENAEKGGV